MPGSIIKKDKSKYLVRLYIGLENGKRKYHSRTIHGGKKAAEQYLNKILREKDLGEFVKPSKEILSDYMNNWLEKEAKTRVRAKTYDNYRDLVRLYINPSLGNNILSSINSEQIKSLYNKMIDNSLSPKTVKNTHGVLRSAFNQAVASGKLHRNPAVNVTLPRQEKKEMRVLSPEETIRFLDATAYSRWKALFSLLITTGMRPGEALALKWKDIDLKDGKVTVNRTLTRLSGSWRLEEPKTPRSRRTIPLLSTVIKDLEEHKNTQEEEKSFTIAGKYKGHSFVFAGKFGEPLDKNNIVNRHFKPILEQTGLPMIRLYDLRHTCATLLLSADVNPKIVSERLGHASINLTMDTYSHVLPSMQKTATEKLENLLYKRQ